MTIEQLNNELSQAWHNYHRQKRLEDKGKKVKVSSAEWATKIQSIYSKIAKLSHPDK